ncbi:hypothetical protein [Rhizobium leguminosarum]|nr:hypothetical protein [Rhizobium leguminosarum]
MNKVDSAIRSIESDVKAGRIKAQDVTWVMLLVERAGLNHRYLDAPRHRTKKDQVEFWLSKTLPEMAPVAAVSPEQENERLKAEIEQLYSRLDRMGDRIHFYSDRIRQQIQTIKSLKAKALETIVHINR